MVHDLARILEAFPERKVHDGQKALTPLEKLFNTQGEIDLEQVETLVMALASTVQFARAVHLRQSMVDEVKRSQRSSFARLLKENLPLYQRDQAC